MTEMHLRKPQFTYSACESKSLKKLEIQNIFTKSNQIKLVFNMIWLMEILKT